MASTYGNDLRLEEIGDGEQSGTWGATTNTNLELIAEALSFGTEAITTNADTHTTTIADGATDPGRSLYLKYTGTLDSTCTITIAPNSISKTWYIENGTSGSQSIIISQGSGANVTIPTGQTKIVYSDGAGSGAAMGEIGTLGVTSLNVSGNIIVSGTVDGVDLQTLNNAVTANTAKTGITTSQASAITANTSKVTNATHSGEVTGSSALTIADNVVDEANLKVSNSPTNGYFLSAQSGNTGGLTWVEAAASVGSLSKTATGSIPIRKSVSMLSDGTAKLTGLSGLGTVPIALAGDATKINTTDSGTSYFTFAMNPQGTECILTIQSQPKIVAATLNANGTVTTSSESSWAGDPATNAYFGYGSVATAERAYVVGLYGSSAQAYIRGVYTTGNAGSVVVNSANTLAVDGGGAAGAWAILSTEEGYFCIVRAESSNIYIKFGSQDASNGQITLASSWTTVASNYSQTLRGVGVDYATKKVVVISTSNANTNADIRCTTVLKGSGTAAGTVSNTVDSGWNSSNYGGIGQGTLRQDGASNKMIFAMQYGKEGQGGATNNVFGYKYWFTVIDTSGTHPVWNNKNSSNDLYDFPSGGQLPASTSRFGTTVPYGSDHVSGAKFGVSGMEYVNIQTDGTSSGTTATAIGFDGFTTGDPHQIGTFTADGSKVIIGSEGTENFIRQYGFADGGAVVGISSNAVSDGQTVEITTVGAISTGHSGLTTGTRVYPVLSTGDLTTTKPGTQTSLGIAVSATEILMGSDG